MLADPGLNSLKPPGSAGNELDLKVIAGKTPGVLQVVEIYVLRGYRHP